MTEQAFPQKYISDIITAMNKIEIFLQGFDEERFVQDEKTIFAVIRALEIVGEATKRVPESIRQKYNTIPWRAMAGMRDKIIHDYTVVNLAVVWKTATGDVPALKPLLEQVIEALWKTK
jgi:uncharacterized protein with HEPN domain